MGYRFFAEPASTRNRRGDSRGMIVPAEQSFINVPKVTRPEKSEPPEPEQDEKKENIMDENRPSILLVDDNEMVLDAVGAAFVNEGFRVYCAIDAENALDLFKQHCSEIRVAVLDDCMPGKSGFELVGDLHKLNPSTRIILTSGYYGDDFGPPPLDPRYAIFLHKPYELETVFKMIRKWLAESSAVVQCGGR